MCVRHGLGETTLLSTAFHGPGRRPEFSDKLPIYIFDIFLIDIDLFCDPLRVQYILD